MSDYIETGLVYLEYRDFAHLGDETIRAAEGAACAAEQDPDSFWDFNDTVYLNQHTPPMNDGGYSDARLSQMAEQIGLDVDAFETCMDDGTYRSQVEDSTSAAQDAGISGTPGFQVNGRVVQWESYEALAAEIESELAGE